MLHVFQILFSDEFYHHKNKARGKKAKDEVKNRLCLLDGAYWSSYEGKLLHLTDFNELYITIA